MANTGGGMNMTMKTCKTIEDFVQMHIDLKLPMPKRTFQETIPLVHRLPRTFPTVHEIFSRFYDEQSKCYTLTHEQALATQSELKNEIWAPAIDIDYKGFGTGGIFRNQLCRYSQTDEGQAYGLQATRNFRLGGAIYFETPEQANEFLSKWKDIRKSKEE